MSIVLEKSTLLNAYYDQRALSSLPNGHAAFFQFGQIDWGFDFIEDFNGKPTVIDIPLDTSVIKNVFHTSNANYAYVNGNIVITTTLSAGEIPEGEQHQFSCAAIKDALDNIIAIAVTQPVWVYSERGLSLEITINTSRTDQVV